MNLPVAVGVDRLRLLNLRELSTHRMRLVTSLAVIAVSSLLLVAVLSTFGSISSSVRAFSSSVSGSADLQVASIAQPGMSAELVDQLRTTVPEAGTVAPLVRDTASIAGADTSVVVLGSDASILSLGGALHSAMSDIDDFDPATSVIAGPGAGVRAGQSISVGGVPVRVAKVVHGEAVEPIADGKFIVAFLPLAQRMTGLSGKVSSILLTTAPGSFTSQLRSAVEREVSGRATVTDLGYAARQVAKANAVTRNSTLLVAMISLVISAFLVFNMMTMAIASRRPTLAMVRAIGGRPSLMVRDLIGEAAIIAVVGGGIGVGLGAIAGQWILHRVPNGEDGDVGATLTYSLPVYAAPAAIGACVVACVGAAAVAARAVLSMSPIEALGRGEGGVETTLSRRWAVVAAVVGVTAIAVGWIVAYTLTGPAIYVSAVVATSGALITCLAITSPMVAAVRAVAGRLRGPGQLAAITAQRTPRRVWATVMTVAVAIAVGVGTSGAMNDLLASVDTAVDGRGDTDLYVATKPATSVPSGPVLKPEVARAVGGVNGVEHVVGSQWSSLTWDAGVVLLEGLSPGIGSSFSKRVSPAVLTKVLAGEGIIASTTLADSLHAGVGDAVRIPTSQGYRSTTIAAIVDYAAIGAGAGAVSLNQLRQWIDRPGETYLQVDVKPGFNKALVQRDVTKAAQAVEPGVDVYTGRDAVNAVRSNVAQSGAFTSAIRWVVAAVGAIALLNTLLLSVIDRRRELGVLRAMGASRKFIGRMMVAEALAVAIVGAVLGVVIGQLVHAIGDRVLAVNIAIAIPYRLEPSILVYVAVASVLCLAGALIPAVRASRLRIVDAIADD